MKKQVLSAVALLSLLATLVISGYANSGRLTVEIPFDFMVGKKTLPAGKYVIQQPGVIGGVRLIRSAEGQARSYVATMSNDTGQRAQSQSKLVFNRYGDTYFLSQIWHAGSGIVQEVPKTAAERALIKKQRSHLAQNATAPEIVTVMAQ